MTSIHWEIAANLTLAWMAGGLIGLERSYHGRAAGFRTHALVGLASAAAMLVALVPSFAPGLYLGAPRLDPTRLAQGILTGIGFLGAGVIFKEGVSVQGLTTAASVWATSVIGMLFGVGEHMAACLTTAVMLITLLMLRWGEERLPSPIYAWLILRFRTGHAPDRDGLKVFLANLGATLREPSYGRAQDGQILEFSGNLRVMNETRFEDLAAALRDFEGLAEFDLSRISK